MKLNIYMFLLIGFCGWQTSVFAQVAISINGSVADPSALLDIQSQDKGLLTPRMTEAQKTAIANPANGLLIYQTDGNSGYYYNEGSPTSPLWKRIGSEQNNPVLKQNRIPIDSVAVFGNAPSPTLYAITEPGSYYLTRDIDITETQFDNTSARVIIINSDNVTLDLNGYSIIGRKDPIPEPLVFPIPGFGNSEGVYILGSKTNITIRNGSIINCGGSGIRADDADNSLFENLKFSNNGTYALEVQDNNVVKNCISFYCRLGIRGRDANHFINCQSHNTDNNGMSCRTGSQFINCISNNNRLDGISTGTGSNAFMKGCVFNNNGAHGVDASLNCMIIQCVASNNEEDGINVFSNCTVQECHTVGNMENGIRTAGSYITILNNHCHGNSLSGISCSSSRALIQGNSMTDNEDIGLFVVANDCLVINNVASGNTDDTSNNSGNTYDPNIQIQAGSSYGPIIDVSGAGDLSNITDADHPKANFIY